MITATYSPEDNKIRLYPSERLDSATYGMVKDAGYKWAPRQKLFVAPAWTPDREAVALLLAGEIGDEDTSLVDRAEERAERFGEYQEKRADDAERAASHVAAITDGIPLGQPILVGHHSERHARKDAERIENGMKRAVKMWETSEYWKRRAAGAVRSAKYKELPGVRARRIKGLEADKRKQERTLVDASRLLTMWEKPEITFEQAIFITNHDYHYSSACFPLAKYPREPPASQYEGSMSLYSALTGGVITADQARTISLRQHRATIARCTEWINHLENRLIYEKAMLDEQGGAELLKPAQKPTQLPLCNYRASEGINIENRYHRGEFSIYEQVEMTKAEYARIYSDYKGTHEVDHSHRVRSAMLKGCKLVCVFLTDSKEHPKPAPGEPAPRHIPTPRPAPVADPRAEKFQAIKEGIKAGVQVVAAPQLFPTPQEIARQMVELADIRKGHRVLEPEAGTGALLREMPEDCESIAVEIDPRLSSRLIAHDDPWPHLQCTYVCKDFLTCTPESVGMFDRIVMNPPFINGADITHITHALTFLKPGGILVALCANGPRQQDQLKPLTDTWEVLPTGSFKEQGTNVNVAMLTMTV